MPVPGGEITTTELWQAPVEEIEQAEEFIAFDENAVKAEEHPATTEEELVQDDLPELS
jgi:hypothetical protein